MLFRYSALDRGDDSFRTRADYKRHGSEPFLLWFLKRGREHDGHSGQRSLDVLDVHYCPASDGLYGSGVVTWNLVRGGPI
jgi:Glycoside hydrolase family 44